jgi:hypothetical protein
MELKPGNSNRMGLHSVSALIFLHQKQTLPGVTPIEHLKLPRKLPRKCPAAPDPRRSLATIVCRPIRVRYTCFSGVLTRMPSLPDCPRTSQISGPAHHRTSAENAYFTGYLPIRISRLPLSYPLSLRKRFGEKNSQYLAR